MLEHEAKNQKISMISNNTKLETSTLSKSTKFRNTETQIFLIFVIDKTCHALTPLFAIVHFFLLSGNKTKPPSFSDGRVCDYHLGSSFVTKNDEILIYRFFTPSFVFCQRPLIHTNMCSHVLISYVTSAEAL